MGCGCLPSCLRVTAIGAWHPAWPRSPASHPAVGAGAAPARCRLMHAAARVTAWPLPPPPLPTRAARPPELYGQAPAWQAYAAARLAAGDAAGAQLALQSAAEPGALLAGGRHATRAWLLGALDALRGKAYIPRKRSRADPLLPLPCPAGTPAKLLAGAVRATLQLHCTAGRPAQALEHLRAQLPVLREARVLQEEMEALWVVAAAGAAAARDPTLLQQALAAARAWAAEADADAAAFQARLCGVQAAASLAAEQPAAAVRQYSAALHLCPTAATPWAGLASALLMRPADGGRSADAALRLCDCPAVAAAMATDRRQPATAPPAGKVSGAAQGNPQGRGQRGCLEVACG